MRLIKWLAAIVAVAAFPAVALASKPANSRQSAALYKAVKAHDPAGIPERCLRFTISTANRSWADVGLKVTSKGVARGCSKWGFNGVTIFHYRSGRWHYVTEGSSFIGQGGGCSLTGRIPRAVIKDLGLC
jgi:hypothetical protein